IIATFIGALCILLFSFVGIFAQMEDMKGQAAVEVSKTLGIVMMLVMNFIMITSAASTLDSTFNSFSKMLVVDLKFTKNITVTNGRIAMIIVALVGTLPVFLNPTILSATTVSGTMVIGLAPVFVFWKAKVPKLSFHLAVGIGVVFGLLLAFKMIPDELIFFEGKYGDLLSVNIIGTVFCLIGFWLPVAFKR
ncbi:MAG: sodium:solute symporter, partial [Saprospiraceae bacterium]